MLSTRHLVFVYGTLTDAERVRTVLSSDREPSNPEFAFTARATLEGLRRVEGEYPTLAPGGATDGRLLAVDSEGVAALDAYEGVDSGLYVRVAIPFADHPQRIETELGTTPEAAAWTYVGDPARLGADVDWPGEGTFVERVRGFVDRESVVIDPSA